jgi:hypothetical protein
MPVGRCLRRVGRGPERGAAQTRVRLSTTVATGFEMGAVNCNRFSPGVGVCRCITLSPLIGPTDNVLELGYR